MSDVFVVVVVVADVVFVCIAVVIVVFIVAAARHVDFFALAAHVGHAEQGRRARAALM